LTLAELHAKKHQKWYPEAHSSARRFRGEGSEEKRFVRPSSAMLASLSPSHFIPAAHHVSSFSVYSTIFEFRRVARQKRQKLLTSAAG
jgi:hypothetical protein